MKEKLKIFIVAGEASGDLHGAKLVKVLKTIVPESEIYGIGGDGMQKTGMELIFHVRDMAVVGFTEVLRHIPFLRKVMRTLQREITQHPPAVAILIDYPGFNLRLAKKLKAEGIPILYYIAPQVWAWGAGRVAKITHLVNEMAVVFPFEVDLFQKAGLQTNFVGHPLLEGLQPKLSLDEFCAELGLIKGKKILGLLPGSRQQEVKRLLPDMIATAQLLQQSYPSLQICIAKAPNLPKALYETCLQNEQFKLVENATYELMRDSTACIVCSGTATLETACFGTPLVVVYRVSKLSYEIGKRLVKLPHIGLVNVVANKKVAPEFIQEYFTPKAVAAALIPFLDESLERKEICSNLMQVQKQLGLPGASEKTAKIALRLAGRREGH